ncbi:hypothetical protein ACHAQH_000311 [Verticillium albo-atrum]
METISQSKGQNEMAKQEPSLLSASFKTFHVFTVARTLGISAFPLLSTMLCTNVRMLNGEGSEKVELQIHRTLKLKNNSRHAPTPASTSDATPNGHRFSDARPSPSSAPTGALERMQLDLDTAREEIERLDTAAWTVVSSFESSVARLDKEMQKLNSTMRDLRRDLERNNEELPRLQSSVAEVRAMVEDKSVLRALEEQLETTNSAVSAVRRLASDAKTGHDELQSELQATKRDLRKVQSEASDLRKDVGVAKKAAKDAVAATEAYAKDFAALRAEVLGMGGAMAQDRARRSDPKGASGDYATRKELNILATNIGNISGQASQVGSLRMEVDLFKPRMERFEARLDAWEAEPRAGSTNDQTLSYSQRLQCKEPENGSRKRRAAEDTTEHSVAVVTPPKRVAFSSDPADSAARSTASFRKQQARRPGSNTSTPVPRIARLTSTGKAASRRSSKRASEDMNAIYTPPDD